MTRVVLVATALHAPAGQLTWPAWQALQAGPVLVAEGPHPQADALRAAGVDLRPVPADRLADAARAGGAVVLLAPGADPLVDALPGAEVLRASAEVAGARLLDAVAVMDWLRSPGGCPWDAAQTHRSLAPYLLEEAYEAHEALEDDDPDALREELGDVLLQVLFHARLAQEADRPWSVDDVAGGLVDKLVRRHPHVFAGATADDLETSWEALKTAEKGRTSVTDGVPLGQPALALAAKLQKRAGRLGAPVPAYDGPGGRLWELVRACREQGVDPEQALRDVARAYRDALAAAERAARAQGRDPATLGEGDWRLHWAGLLEA